MMLTCLSVFLLSFLPCVLCVTVITTVPDTSNGDAYIAAVLGEANVTLECVLLFNGDQFNTRWFIQRQSLDSVVEEILHNNGVPSSPANLVDLRISGDFVEILTITNFTDQFDMSIIQCGREQLDERKTFHLGFPLFPVLVDGVTEQVDENSSYTFSIETTTGFPPIPSQYQWYYNNVAISQDSTSPIVSVYPDISFTSVSRNDSGTYSITVTNDAGSINGSFVLDVLFPPEGVSTSGPFRVLVGDSVTITGYTSISGNPTPTQTWSFKGNQLTTGGRFNTNTLGQLTISSVTLNDTGNYINTLSGTNTSIDNTVELIVAAPASMPRTVSLLSVGAEYVNISWMNPTNLGTPTFSQFRIVAESCVNNVSLTVDATSTSDSSFTNMMLVEGLKPSVEYKLTIVALSSVEQLGVLTSELSEVLTFNTTVGAPRISSAVLENINGNLSITWEFLHTGGSGLETVTVQCSDEADSDDSISASSNGLGVVTECTSNEQCETGSVSVGPVIAGGNYSCVVFAENNIGEDELRTNYVLANTGLPSVPMIVNVTGGAGVATITVRVDEFGVNTAADFTLIVSIFNNSQSVIPESIRMVSIDSIASPLVMIVIDNLRAGMFYFTVSSSNSFGSLAVATEMSQQPAIVEPTQSTTITTSTNTIIGPSTTSVISSTTTSSTSSSQSLSTATPTATAEATSRGLSGGAIAGIVIAIIILVAIIAIVVFIVVYIVIQNRGDSYKVEGGKVVVEEHDIDIGTELQSSKSLGDEQKPEVPEPKRELHYADLADFAPKSSSNAPPTASQTAKPMPIEEVQYAVIRPQDRHKVDGSVDDDKM